MAEPVGKEMPNTSLVIGVRKVLAVAQPVTDTTKIGDRDYGDEDVETGVSRMRGPALPQLLRSGGNTGTICGISPI
jgi:hypothetical protein